VAQSLVQCLPLRYAAVPYCDSTLQRRAVWYSTACCARTMQRGAGLCSTPRDVHPSEPCSAQCRAAARRTARYGSPRDGVFVCVRVCVCLFLCARRTFRPRSGTRAAPASGRRRFGCSRGRARTLARAQSCARARPGVAVPLGGCSCCGSGPRRCKVAPRIGSHSALLLRVRVPFSEPATRPIMLAMRSGRDADDRKQRDTRSDHHDDALRQRWASTSSS
jgi:hypothetical protein